LVAFHGALASFGDDPPILAGKADSMGALAMKLIRDEGGATAIEYALVASLIALVIVGAVTALSGKVQLTYNNVAGALK
jgi:pilus assembly protein Flp/PilA